MSDTTIAAASAEFGRDLDACFATIEGLVADARAQGVDLLVLPEAALGGYVETLHGDNADHPPPLDLDGPEVRRVAEMAGDMVVTVGFCEDGGDGVRYNAAACVSGGEVLGSYRKIHLPLDEHRFTTASDEPLAAFDTPVGRIGMLICYDKAFPEAARTLAVDGAEVLCSMSAWPISATNAAARMEDDRQYMRSMLWDQSRAAENSYVHAAANQSGMFGRLQFLGSSRVVGPGGEVRAQAGTEGGLAVTTLDVHEQVEHARKALSPIRDLRPDVYREPAPLARVA